MLSQSRATALLIARFARTAARCIPWAIVFIISTSVVSSFAAAEDDRKAEDSRNTNLFDGESLEGWKPTAFYMAGSVQVRDGAILLATGASMTGITTTRKDLPKSNYELVYEAKRIDGPDFFAAATFPVSESHITFVNGGWGGTVTGLSSLNGADASENETTTGFRYESGVWYRFRIRVTDKAIACWVNDKRLALVPHTERLIGMRPESRKSKPLGFASWKTTGAIRGITMKTLSAAEISETDAALKPDD